MAFLLKGSRKKFVDINVNKFEAEAVIEGFKELTWAMQKKYLAKAIKRTAESQIASLKAAAPRNKGKLGTSAGVSVSKAKKKGRGGKLALAWVHGRIGYRRGKTAKGRYRGGYVSHWVESGVKRRRAKYSSLMKVDWTRNRKYRYLKPMRRKSADGQDFVFLGETAPVKGQRFFRKWLNGNRRKIQKKLEADLADYLKDAIREGQQKARRSALKRASKQLVVI